MPKKKTKEEFIAKAKLVHGDKYDYSKVEYVGALTKVCIICPKHGEFCQEANSHLRGQGCPKCKYEKQTCTTDEFIAKAKKIHGDKYDYSKVEYVNDRTKVCIICPKHGEFWQTPNSHLNGYGCSKCAYEVKGKRRSFSKEEFIKKTRKVHGDKYDYSKVNYVNNYTKVCIICPEHGEFWQTPSAHLRGQGCPKCKSKKQTCTTDEFIAKAKKIHGDKYDYSKVEYVNRKTKVCIICPKHGEFWQTPNHHLSGCGCPKCGIENHCKNKLSCIE
jgi:hypothetical protein